MVRRLEVKDQPIPERITFKSENCELPANREVLCKPDNGNLVLENVDPKMIADKMEIVARKFHGPELVHGTNTHRMQMVKAWDATAQADEATVIIDAGTKMLPDNRLSSPSM
ncbi:hypothetical protein MUP01_10145 [Candidatus Bathyarchaeota archaeon]|nr:hypothetical protein [Candidatus Bathyarchaeota archaeon]